MMHQARALRTAAPGDSGLGGHLAEDRKGGPLPRAGTRIQELPATTGIPDGQLPGPGQASSLGIGGIRPVAPGVRGRPPCPVYPITDVCGPGTAPGEAAAGARSPMSTRHGCGVTATSRLLKCRCSAMVDVINNAISDLFFPV